MSEETQPVSTEQPASTEAPAPEQTLDDVYESYKVGVPEPQQPQYQPPQQYQQPPQQGPHIPDPALDYEGFKRYEATKSQESQVLRHAALNMHQRLSQFEQRAVQQAQEADIKQAVGSLKEKNPDHDDEFLEVSLGTKARKDPKFLTVWNNRHQNPRAWDAAVKAYGNELAGKFSARADPQLAENQRAMKTAQSAMGTAQKAPTREEALGKLQGSDFDREWERIKSG